MNILSIHSIILETLALRENNLKYYEEYLSEISKILKTINLSYKTYLDLQNKEKEISKLISDIKLKTTFDFYMMSAEPYIQKYSLLLEKPVRISFMKKTVDDSKEKNEIIEGYRKMIEKLFISSNDIWDKISEMMIIIPKEEIQTSICEICGCNDYDIFEGNNSVCTGCGNQKEINFLHTSSYKDVDRISITKKYKYDRRQHFRDRISQLQGKQNSTISNKVYEDLYEQFKLNGLVDGKEGDPKDIRYSRITKEHIYLFLKETGHVKHYEDDVLIYHNITGKKPMDLSNYEDLLIADYNLLVDLYDRRYKNKANSVNFIQKKNFLNSDYVIYQLLKRHGYPCKRENFGILKTIDRIIQCDDICKELFEELGWNFTPYF